MRIRRAVVVPLFVVLAALLSAVPLDAAERCTATCSRVATIRSSAVRLESGLVVVPFAVPVAVPVATIARPTVLYSYQQYASPDAEHVAPPEERRDKDDSVRPAAVADGVAEVLQRCAACHQGPSAKGDLRLFDDLGRLYEQLPRHRIYKMVASGKMPPEGSGLEPLDDDERHRLLEWALDLPDDVVY